MSKEPTEGRRERKKRQTREAIAETAMRLFAERGYDAVTIADVASAADVATTTVFNYFKTKEDLFFGAFTPPTELLAERLRERAPGVGPVPILRKLLLEALVGLSARDAHEHHHRIRSVMAASQALQAQAMHRFRARRLESLNQVAAALTAPAEPDAFALLVAAQMLSQVDGAMGLAEQGRRAGKDPVRCALEMRSALDRACDALEKGLGDYGVQPAPSASTRRAKKAAG
ncbi:MAG TPA: TetR/AcrR family transcriptional regulator [Oscillatoriaceae cyanobacterium]